VRTRLSTAFELRVPDPTAGEQVLVTLNIGTGSIVYDVSLVEPSQLFVLSASPTNLTWSANFTPFVTLTLTNPPSGQVTISFPSAGFNTDAIFSANDQAAALLYEACEPGVTGGANAIHGSHGSCVAEIPDDLNGSTFRFLSVGQGDYVKVLRIGTESVTFTLNAP